jgi:hypothetical protein
MAQKADVHAEIVDEVVEHAFAAGYCVCGGGAHELGGYRCDDLI